MAQDSPGARTGRRLRALREERLLTQPGLAKKAKVSELTVRKIETGLVPHPRLSTVEKLAAGLGVSVEDVIGPPSPLSPAMPRPLDDDTPPEAWPLSLARMLRYEADEAARVKDLEGASPQELSHLLRDIERQRAIAGREMVRAEPGDMEDWRRYINGLEEVREEVAPYVAGPPEAQEMAATLASGAA